MSLTTFSLNGVPIENYGLVPSELRDWISVPARQYPVAQTPMRPGVIPLGTASTVGTRAMLLKAYVQATSLLDRRAKLGTLLRQLGGQLEVVSAEDPSKLCYAYLAEAPVTTPFRAFVTPQVFAELRLMCFDPLWYDVEPTVGGAAAGTPVLLAVGSAPMRRLRFQIIGAAVNPYVSLRRASGVEIARMSFTITLGANDVLDVDCDAYTITKSVAGTVTTALSTLASTENFFLVDEAQDCVLVSSAGALQVTSFRSWW